MTHFVLFRMTIIMIYTCFVYEVQSLLMKHIRKKYSHIENIEYFSDGCAGQYKNFENFLNLCYHKNDFALNAEWIFFATSHGKYPCDGIGGSVKRHVAKRSLQRPLNNQILTYKQMLDVCNLKIKNITFIGIDKEQMIDVRKICLLDSIKEKPSLEKEVITTSFLLHSQQFLLKRQAKTVKSLVILHFLKLLTMLVQSLLNKSKYLNTSVVYMILSGGLVWLS